MRETWIVCLRIGPEQGKTFLDPSETHPSETDCFRGFISISDTSFFFFSPHTVTLIADQLQIKSFNFSLTLGWQETLSPHSLRDDCFGEKTKALFIRPWPVHSHKLGSLSQRNIQIVKHATTQLDDPTYQSCTEPITWTHGQVALSKTWFCFPEETVSYSRAQACPAHSRIQVQPRYSVQFAELIPLANKRWLRYTLPFLQAWHSPCSFLCCPLHEDHKLVTLPDPANSHLLFEPASGIFQEDKIIYYNPHFFQVHLELFLHHMHGPFYVTASVLSADDNADTVVVWDWERMGTQRHHVLRSQTAEIWIRLCR